MNIQIGFDIQYECSALTPFILMLNVHPVRERDLLTPDTLYFTQPVVPKYYLDGFGNKCARIVAAPGIFGVSSRAVVADAGRPDIINPAAAEHAVADLPNDTLVYLLASRYCDTDLLVDKAWQLFGNAPSGWAKVQTICDFVHNHIEFGYPHAVSTRTASQAFVEQKGVCRDFAHLAISFCRCLNIPARYCTGYLGDIGVPSDPAPMDFSAWFEAFIGGRWYTFDARHNVPRIGRVLIARGRDAADVAISTAFGTPVLKSFQVTTYEVADHAAAPRASDMVA